MKHNEIVACFPQWGNYAPAFKYICEQGFDVKYLIPPPITKRTLELGSKYSPDFVCVPFKYCLGCYIEALEKGANCLMQIYGACRLDFYGELSEQILGDMGYKFKFFNMAEIDWRSVKSILNNFKKINPSMNVVKVAAALPTTFKIVETIDEFENYIRKNVGFEVNEGEFEKTYKEFLDKVSAVKNAKEFGSLRKEYKKKLKNIKVDKPSKTIKVGMVGDYYTVQEPYSNFFMEKELAKQGMEVLRYMNLTSTIIKSQYKKRVKVGKKYAKYNLGATGNYTVAESIEFAKQGADGIIHVKSFGCTPELDAMPILQNISRDFNIPILHFSFDSQTSETGVKTRLEAFHDMVVARKNK